MAGYILRDKLKLYKKAFNETQTSTRQGDTITYGHLLLDSFAGAAYSTVQVDR